MTSPYSRLLLICDVAEQFIADSKVPDLQENILMRILRCLLSAETILDTGRSVLPSGSSMDFDADKRAVNDRMDTIRKEIITLMQRLGKEKVEALLDSQANQLRTEWVHNL